MKRLAVALSVACATSFLGFGAVAQQTGQKKMQNPPNKVGGLPPNFKKVAPGEKALDNNLLIFEVSEGKTAPAYRKPSRPDFRWTLKRVGGASVSKSSQGYPSREECIAAIERIKTEASEAKLEEPAKAGATKVEGKPAKATKDATAKALVFELTEDVEPYGGKPRPRYLWMLKGVLGEELSRSPLGYSKKEERLEEIERIKQNATTATIVDNPKK